MLVARHAYKLAWESNGAAIWFDQPHIEVELHLFHLVFPSVKRGGLQSRPVVINSAAG